MDKESFLNNIRTQLQAAHLPEAAVERPAVPPLAPFEPPALIEQFGKELELVNGVFKRVANEAEARNEVLALFEQYEVVQFLSWEDDHLPISGLNGTLQERYERLTTNLPPSGEERTVAQQGLEGAQVGVTGSLGAMADTGSLALQFGAGRGRHASLLPPVHIAIITAEQLVPSMAHFISANRDANHQASNVVFITGPSRTADIEQTLTLGVHGPKELIVILIEGS